jgi:hypothetical protein
LSRQKLNDVFMDMYRKWQSGMFFRTDVFSAEASSDSATAFTFANLVSPSSAATSALHSHGEPRTGFRDSVAELFDLMTPANTLWMTDMIVEQMMIACLQRPQESRQASPPLASPSELERPIESSSRTDSFAVVGKQQHQAQAGHLRSSTETLDRRRLDADVPVLPGGDQDKLAKLGSRLAAASSNQQLSTGPWGPHRSQVGAAAPMPGGNVQEWPSLGKGPQQSTVKSKRVAPERAGAVDGGAKGGQRRDVGRQHKTPAVEQPSTEEDLTSVASPAKNRADISGIDPLKLARLNRRVMLPVRPFVGDKSVEYVDEEVVFFAALVLASGRIDLQRLAEARIQSVCVELVECLRSDTVARGSMLELVHTSGMDSLSTRMRLLRALGSFLGLVRAFPITLVREHSDGECKVSDRG